MKTYAIPGLGSLLMHHQLVATLGGLLVRIDPELSFSNDMEFMHSVHDNVMYTLSVEIPCSVLDLTHDFVQDGLKDAWKSFASLVDRFWPEPSEPRNQTYSSMQKDLSVPLLQAQKAPTPIQKTIDGNEYTIHWRLEGTDLKEWIKSKLLYVIKEALYISVQTYLTQNQGLYHLTWTKSEGYQINYGQVIVSQDTGVRFLGSYLTAKVLIFGKEHEDQDIRIDFDVQAIKIPGSIYKVMENKLRAMKFTPSKNEGKCGRSQGDCHAIFSDTNMSPHQKHELDIKINFSMKTFIDLKALYYIKRKRDTCTIFIEKSEDETWVLGNKATS
ncbi:hypothetical protein ABG067_003835 [Albugo candida]